MVTLRHMQIRNKRKKVSLVFTALVCWSLRAAETTLSVENIPHVSTVQNSTLQSETPDQSVQVESSDQSELDFSQAETVKFAMSLPFPFEVVHRTWENGPPDENLIREDVQVSLVGTEEIKKKFIYTKNPLPFLLRKTIIRTEEVIFEEEQRIDLRHRYSKAWSVNRCFESLVQARRTFDLKEDPEHKGWSILEQSLAVSASSALGNTVKQQLEKFALSIFYNTCESSTNELKKTIADHYAKSEGSLQNLANDPVEQEDEEAPRSPELQSPNRGLRKVAGFFVKRGAIVAGAALRVWSMLRAPHHTCPKQLAPGACPVPTVPLDAAVMAEHQQQAKLTKGKDAFTNQQQQHPGHRINPMKRVMSVPAAAFVSV
mmetsp:Transcript_41501/g.84843  ORF Transcript_41501/g.84843 Transcript_41501/m.84843 type:complete len:373 (+) Transcript_41501:109-1227(+)|eukprot:CAMPEP_0181313784 /NCGR_PEP_ID=MMETSP1101-20121128/14442_1 /TAXON_ID=46948 /ORGANISM="Rhodomonas abbreviata, Strain Caron Lab Isolate" /LENGTH=372 /DNA_ID=CAMNT_0023420779 /DNA_START=107 /DNA_END=1225 /DNA_ORIENTATION=+